MFYWFNHYLHCQSRIFQCATFFPHISYPEYRLKEVWCVCLQFLYLGHKSSSNDKSSRFFYRQTRPFKSPSLPLIFEKSCCNLERSRFSVSTLHSTWTRTAPFVFKELQLLEVKKVKYVTCCPRSVPAKKKQTIPYSKILYKMLGCIITRNCSPGSDKKT